MNLRTLLIAILLIALAIPAAADEAEVPGWYFDADLAGVWTGGNSESNALGAGAQLRRVLPGWRFTLDGVASQTQTTTTSRTATGTPDAFDVNETKVTEKSAEYYNLTAIALHDISKYFFLLGGADWTRNRPAGIESRTLLALGAGNTWWTGADSSFRTFYNATYTFEDEVVTNPFTSKEFPGLQFGYELKHQASTSTRLESTLVADWNLDDTDDVRVDWLNALPVSINSRLELKPSLRLLWRNSPALEELTLVDGGGTPTGGVVLSDLDAFDTIFTLALVIKFHPAAEEG